jgi:hypothetical protein
VQGLDEVGLDDEPPAGGVDEHAAVAHQGEPPPVHHPAVLRHQRTVQRDDVRLREEPVEVGARTDGLAGPVVAQRRLVPTVDEDLAAEGEDAPGHRSADAAEAHDADAGALQPEGAGAVGPLRPRATARHVVVQPDQVTPRGEHQQQRVLRDGLRRPVGADRHRDPVLAQRGEVQRVDPHALPLHQPQVGSRPQVGAGQGRVGVHHDVRVGE